MAERRVKRILIVGVAGSGKTTFSRKLGKALNLEVHHLDRYYWKPGWVETGTEEWENILTKLLTKESWIIEGNYSNTFRMRAQYAEKIFMFDPPRAKSVYRISKRIFKSKFGIEKRTDLGEGCREKWFDKNFFKWVWNYNRNIRPRMYNILEDMNFNKEDIIIFKTNKDVKKYLNSLTRAVKNP